MRALSRIGVGLAVVSALLLLALTAELYYIFVHKRRLRRRAAAISDAASSPSSSSRELLQLFCFKKPPALASTYAVQEPAAVSVAVGGDGEEDDDETVEAQLMRLGSVVGPTRLLFTIKEETREDLESEDGRSRSRSLGELLHCSETPPFLTPGASPGPTAAMDNSYNPLFESPAASPGPGPTVAAAQVPVPQRRGGEAVPPGAGRGGDEGAEVAAATDDVAGRRRGRGRVHYHRCGEEQPGHPRAFTDHSRRWPSVRELSI